MIATGVMVLTVLLCSGESAALAPDQRDQATIVQTAPVYLGPDSTRTPLRMLPANMQVRVLGREGDWLRVEFRDPQFGPRVGYVEAKHVRFFEGAATPEALFPDPGAESPFPGDAPFRQPSSSPSHSSGPTLRGYGTYGSLSFAAADTLRAVAGASAHPNVGGGLVIGRLWRDTFVEVGVSQTRVDGHRVFIDEGTVYNLGIPLQLTVRPLDVAGGWRMRLGRWSPFVGAGMTSLSYRETGGFAEQGDDVSGRRSGALALAGLDVNLLRWMQVGAELRYRRVRGILGDDGVSDAFGEDQIGGVSAGLRVSLGL